METEELCCHCIPFLPYYLMDDINALLIMSSTMSMNLNVTYKCRLIKQWEKATRKLPKTVSFFKSDEPMEFQISPLLHDIE